METENAPDPELPPVDEQSSPPRLSPFPNTDPAIETCADPSNFTVSVQAPVPAEQREIVPGVFNVSGNGEDAFNQGIIEKRRGEVFEGGVGGSKNCSCKKSKCLKLYCMCFTAGVYCSEACGCEPCFNKPAYADHVQSFRREALLRHRHVFSPKAVQASETGMEAGEELHKSPSSRKGCNCKKSGCLKKYCDCYQTGTGCSISCRCDDCKNPFGRKVGLFMDGRLLPSIRREDDDLDSEDDDDDPPPAHSPIPPSPVSRESSFQQDVAGDNRLDTANGSQLYPQPLARLQPLPWLCAKRQRDDGGNAGSAGGGVQHSKKHPKQDDYSIRRCIEVMNGMYDLSPHEKSVAPDVFLDPSNREIFLSLSVDVRMMWLQRKLKDLL